MLKIKKDLREVKKVIEKLRSFNIGVREVQENKNTYDLILVNMRGEIIKTINASEIGINWYKVSSGTCEIANVFFQSRTNTNERAMMWSNKGSYTIVNGIKIILE